jgi:ketosteroid isomerase-like protein
MARVEAVRTMLDAVARRDMEGLMALIEPDVELVSVMSPAEGGAPYTGHDGIREWWANTFGAWADYRLEPLDLIELEEHVFGLFDLAGKGQVSGVGFERKVFLAFHVPDGRAKWIFGSFEVADGLRAIADRLAGSS